MERGSVHKWKVGRWKLVAFSILPSLLLFGVAEAGLRIYVRVKAERERGRALPTPAERNVYQRPDPVLGFALSPGYDVGGIRINALGFRGPEITTPKPRGTFRIVAIGDSTTFGLAGESCSYPAQLQTLLLSRRGQTRFEVINAGVEGYRADYALRLLETRVSRVEPDVVILFVGWNDLYSTDPFQPHVPDLYEDLQEARMVTRHTAAVSGTSLVDHSYVLQLQRRLTYLDLPRIRARFTGAMPAPALELHPIMARRYANRLTRLARRTRELGATPVLVTLPSVLSEQMNAKALSIVHYPQWAKSDYRLFLKVINAFNRTIRDVARDEDAPLVDAAASIDHLGLAKETLFFDSVHFYCEGYGLLARAFLDELVRQRVTP